MIRDFRGQRYVLAGTIPHVRKDGSETSLHEWHSDCASCENPFVLRTPAASRKWEPNRRCQRCKRPGQRVKAVKP